MKKKTKQTKPTAAVQDEQSRSEPPTPQVSLLVMVRMARYAARQLLEAADLVDGRDYGPPQVKETR